MPGCAAYPDYSGARYTLQMQTSRREFLMASTLAPVATRLMAASAPGLEFPAARRERIAVASYPFRGPRLNIMEFPAMVAKRFQIRNIELLGQHIRATDPGYLVQLLAAVKAAGSHVVNIPTSVGASVYD